MVRVSIDVPALRGVVSDLETLVGKVATQRSAVSSAAARACAGVTSFGSLTEHVGAIEDVCGELTSRIDLAILVNTGADGRVPDGVLTYDVTSDTLASVQRQIGNELARLAEQPMTALSGEHLAAFNEMFERYVDDELAMSAFYLAVGPEGLLTLMTEIAQRSGGVDIDLDLQRTVLDNLQSGLETASHYWTDSQARRYADQLVEAAVTNPNDSDNPYLAAGFPGALSAMVAATPREHLQRWPIRDRKPLKQWSKGRITLAGDAAHATSPYAARRFAAVGGRSRPLPARSAS
jgi:hypothetical protein